MTAFHTTLTGLTAAALIALAPLATTPASASELDPGQAASAACATPNAPASTAVAAVPQTPTIAMNMNLTGTTYVQVDLDATGAVVDASVAKSSGLPVLDQAAIAAAHASSFRPEIRDCTPVAGSYLFLVDFPE